MCLFFCAAPLLLLEAMLSDVCGAKPQVALSPRNLRSVSRLFLMLELLCCGLVVLLLQLLQQSCWQAPCGEVGRVGQAARVGSLEKRPHRSRLRRDAISHETACWPNQHATNLFFCNSLDGLPGGALGPPAGSAGSLRWERKCVWHTSNSHTGSWGSVVPSECLASQFPASVAGRSSQRPWVSCLAKQCWVMFVVPNLRWRCPRGTCIPWVAFFPCWNSSAVAWWCFRCNFCSRVAGRPHVGR